MVIAGYPAETNTSEAHSQWMPERWALSEAKLLYYQRLNSPNPLTLGETLRAIHGSVSSSTGEAPPAQTKNLWPLLLFYTGAGVNPAFYSTFTEDLASHGSAVFAIVPTGWVDTIFPDGHGVPASDKRSALNQAQMKRTPCLPLLPSRNYASTTSTKARSTISYAVSAITPSPLFSKYNMKSLAYWTPADDPLKGKTLVCILEHPSREAATANWQAFRDDPEWHSVRDKSEANGKLVDHMDSTYLTLTDFSPPIR